MKELLENIGNFNGWKGNICLYFPKKKVRELKRYGITEDMDIKQAYLKVSNIKTYNYYRAMKLITKEIKKRLENILSTHRMVKRKKPSVKQSSSFVLVHGLGSYWKQT